jgi:serine/threonine protein kinase/tetratricopeptide (TPR) repeat protein
MLGLRQRRGEVTILCPNCRKENPDDQKFCGECGTPLPQKEDEVLTKTLETSTDELTTGTTFAGRYQIIEELGKGGMGRVYKVLDKETKDKMALKLIKPEIASDRKTIDRFRNELSTARRIAHRNVCRMYDLNKEKDSYYITMEFVSGGDLKRFLRRSKRLDTGTAISIAKQICAGLEEAHSLGIVHRDLKPNNIMLDDDGNARIMDFGIARTVKGKGITGSGMIIGTPEYMSPEQAEAKEVDQRSDIYSLGVILYEMTAGRLPFEGETPLAVAMKHKGEAVKSPKEFNPQIPESLNRVILTCLEKEKENRYQSAGEVKSELERIEQGLPTTDRVIPQKKPLTSKEITVKITPRRLLIPALVISAAAVFVIALLLFLPGREPVRHSVAVVSFDNQTGSEAFDYLRTVIPNLLITGLGQSREIHVISWERMHDSLVAMGETETGIIDTELGFKLCQREGIEAIVTGSFIKTGDLFTTDVKMLEVESKNLLKSASANGQGIESIMANQINELAKEISRGLGLPERKALSSQVKIADVTTSSMEAYNYYIQGKEASLKAYMDDARKYLEKAVLLDPEFASAYLILARAYSSLGDTKASLETWEKAKKYSTKAPQRERLEIERLYAFNVEGDNKKNIQILKQIIEEFPSATEVHYSLGYAYVTEGLEDEGIREYETYIKVHPNPMNWAYINLGDIYAGRKELGKAMEYIKKAVSVSPDDANVVDYLADIYFKMGDLDQSISQFERVLDIKPDFYQAYYRIAYVHSLREEYDKVLDYLEKFSLMAPSSARKAESLGWRAFLCYWLGKFEDSLALASQIPGMVERVENRWIEGYATYLPIVVSWSRGDFEQGKDFLKAANEHMLKYFPERQRFDEGQFEFFWGLQELKEGKTEGISDRLERIMSIYEEINAPWTIYTYWILDGHLALKENRYEDALASVNKALSMRWPFYYMHSNWLMSLNTDELKDLTPRIYKEMGDLDGAIQAYEQITAFDPESEDRCMIHPTWHYELAKLYEQKGENDKAAARYEKFLDLWKGADPGLPEVEETKRRLAGLR